MKTCIVLAVCMLFVGGECLLFDKVNWPKSMWPYNKAEKSTELLGKKERRHSPVFAGNDEAAAKLWEDRRQKKMHKEAPKKSCNLNGTWHNQLGSELKLTHLPNGQLTGEYKTAVERARGLAGLKVSNVFGVAHDSLRMFGFTVVWDGGMSVTSWTGQCHVCDGRESIQATWVLTEHSKACDARWKANRFGQDVFTRA